MKQKEIEEKAQKMAKGERNLVEWLDKLVEDRLRELGLRPMTDEEWEEHKAKRQQAPVTGTITFLKGESAKKWLRLYLKRKKNNTT